MLRFAQQANIFAKKPYEKMSRLEFLPHAPLCTFLKKDGFNELSELYFARLFSLLVPSGHILAFSHSLSALYERIFFSTSVK